MYYKVFLIYIIITCFLIGRAPLTPKNKLVFNQYKDFISLHYDHASDKDDGHSAAADRTVLEVLFGKEWIRTHTIPVSGMCGTNCPTFRHESDKLMQKIWGSHVSWLHGLLHRKKTIRILVTRYTNILKKGGHIWIKEGGQSNVTAMVLSKLATRFNHITLKKKIHVVQHSAWNESHTNKDLLQYVKQTVDYIKIKDANPLLREYGGNARFERAALFNIQFRYIWTVAFKYLSPRDKLDFSDTAELLYILGYDDISIKQFIKLFLKKPAKAG